MYSSGSRRNVRVQQEQWLRKASSVMAVVMISFLVWFTAVGCESAAAGGDDADSSETEADEDELPDVPEDDALAAFLFVFHDFNYYAMRTPAPEGTSEFFANGTVTVTKQDSTDDLLNAYYEDTVRVVFDDYTGNAGSICGTGELVAFIDSYNGSEGATYSGAFNGSYNGASFTMSVVYGVENSAGTGIRATGTYTLNGRTYELRADPEMIYDFSGI